MNIYAARIHYRNKYGSRYVRSQTIRAESAAQAAAKAPSELPADCSLEYVEITDANGVRTKVEADR